MACPSGADLPARARPCMVTTVRRRIEDDRSGRRARRHSGGGNSGVRIGPDGRRRNGGGRGLDGGDHHDRVRAGRRGGLQPPAREARAPRRPLRPPRTVGRRQRLEPRAGGAARVRPSPSPSATRRWRSAPGSSSCWWSATPGRARASWSSSSSASNCRADPLREGNARQRPRRDRARGPRLPRRRGQLVVSRRVQGRAARPHRVRAPVRAPDVRGVGPSRQQLLRPRCRRSAAP